MRVGVCVPCRDEVHTGFAFDFARMAAHDASVRCKDGKGGLSLYTMPGTLIFDQREKLAQVALSGERKTQLWNELNAFFII